MGLEVVLADLGLGRRDCNFQAEVFGNPLESSHFMHVAILDDNTLFCLY